MKDPEIILEKALALSLGVGDILGCEFNLSAWSEKGKLVHDISHRVDRDTVEPQFVMKMGARGSSAHSDLGNLLPPVHLLSHPHQDVIEVGIARGYSKPVGDHQQLSKS